MKFDQLQLCPFGPFDALTLDFSGGTQSLHLVCGPNEAGKSTTLRAITGFLYGIPTRSRDGFLYPNSDLRIVARIESKLTGEITLSRRKGAKNTLTDNDRQPVDESRLSQFLGGLDETTFANMYGLSHETLVEGGKGLLDSGGAMAESLFQAGTGLADLRTTLSRLDDEAQSLFAPRRKNATINAAREKYDQAAKATSEQAVLSRTWATLEEEFREKNEKIGKARAEVRALSAEMQRLERYLNALPHYRRHLVLSDEIAQLGEVPILPPSAARDREKAQKTLEDNQAASGRHKAAIEKTTARLREIDVSPLFLSHEETVLLLQQQLGSKRKADADLPNVRHEQRADEEQARRILREIGADLALEQVESIRPTALHRIRIRDLISSHRSLAQKLADKRDTIAQAEMKLGRAKREIAALPERADTFALSTALQAAQRFPQIDEQIAAETSKCDLLSQQVLIATQQLPLWDGTPESLEQLPVPAHETIERYDGLFREADNREKGIGQRRDDVQGRLQAVENQIAAHRLGGDLPTEDDLLNARNRRDRGWRLVQAAWGSGRQNDMVDNDFAPDQPLAAAFGHSIVDADTVGDRLRSDANRVAEYAAMLKTKNDILETRREIEETADAFAAQRALLKAEWEEVWQPLGISPLPPMDMRSWLTRQTRTATDIAALRQAKASVRDLEDKRRDLATALVAPLRDMGLNAAQTQDDGPVLAPLMAQARQKLQEIADMDATRGKLSDRIAVLEEAIANDCSQRDRAAADLDKWQADWSAAVRTIGLSQATTPDEADAVLEQLTELFRCVDKAARNRLRVTGMERDASEFDAKVADVVRAVANDLASASSEQAAVTLGTRLAKMREESVEQSQLRKQMARDQDQLAECEAAIFAATATLEHLMWQAQCGTVADLVATEEKSERLRTLKGNLTTVQETLGQFAASGSLDRLFAELSAIDPDTLSSQIADLDLQIRTWEHQMSGIDQAIGSIRERRDRINGNDAAATAASQAQNALAEIRSGVERYVRVRVAHGLLKRYMDLYREQNQGPVLKMASALFSRLTLGSFAGLLTDFDDSDNSVLQGIKPNGKTVPVEGMSSGTRDVLFLALRLASLHHQLAASEPIPFILDDILVNLDDQRAAVTLKVLAELSEKTQVLFFTHHDHLRQLAESVIAPDVLRVHILNRTA
jgi:uncharacterized protein YhaN